MDNRSGSQCTWVFNKQKKWFAFYCKYSGEILESLKRMTRSDLCFKKKTLTAVECIGKHEERPIWRLLQLGLDYDGNRGDGEK